MIIDHNHPEYATIRKKCGAGKYNGCWYSVIYSGHTILLPMSIDTEYVKQFRTEKTKDTCFAGNRWDNMTDPSVLVAGKVDFFSALPREKLLKEIAKLGKEVNCERISGNAH